MRWKHLFLTTATMSFSRLCTAINNYTCHNATHPNPVVILHGLVANEWDDILALGLHIESFGFCVYNIRYGAYSPYSLFAGLMPVNESAVQIADFIKHVQNRTAAAMVDLVGHSLGAFMGLYVPKFEPGISEIVDRVVSIGPPIHGTTDSGLYTLAKVDGKQTQIWAKEIVDFAGCPSCQEVQPDGAATLRMDDGKPIVQPGNNVTIIASKHDEQVTPPPSAFVNETGVQNLWVQDFCPDDPAGHFGLIYDENVWAMVVSTLQGETKGPEECTWLVPPF
jgi:pimeloyl-ACP methyl ester carboxylesterase